MTSSLAEAPEAEAAEQPAPQPTQAEQDEAALREAFELGENVRRLGRLLATKSIGRNLKTEDEVFRREMLVDEDGKPNGSTATPDMENTAARDVIINNYASPPAQATPAAPAPAAPVTTTPAPETPAVTPAIVGTAMDLAKKAAIAAALIGLGISIPVVLNRGTASEPAKPATAPVKLPALDLLPPDLTPPQDRSI